MKSHLFGYYGFQSKSATTRLINELKRIQPDIVHLHNLHGHNVHLGELFAYLKANNIKIYWTFHDCWTFTAYCPYYDIVKCNKWQTSCHNCPLRTHYSLLFDRSCDLYERKKMLFKGLDLTIITPSYWLAEQVRQSFLKDYPIHVIYNGINLLAFQPHKSDFRERYDIGDKVLLLGVAFAWGKRKGLDVFVRLAKQLDSKKFQIVLVGTNNTIDKQLPSNVISIHRTNNQQELAEIYSAADLFVNPTREEVLGMVNIEANACGTPVLTYRTGGSPECIDETSGIIVDCDDEEALYKAVLKVAAERPFTSENCRKRAEEFSAEKKFQEYVDLLLKSDKDLAE